MGQTDYYTQGKGMTERQALQDAEDQATDYYGHQEGYSGTINSRVTLKSRCVTQPKRATKCKKERSKSNPRKWKTVYTLSPCGFYENEMERERLTVDFDGTIANAIKEAEKLALKYNVEYTVEIRKKLIEGTSHVASITPKESVMGIWEFSGLARE